jgi:hypothetical protein
MMVGDLSDRSPCLTDRRGAEHGHDSQRNGKKKCQPHVLAPPHSSKSSHPDCDYEKRRRIAKAKYILLLEQEACRRLRTSVVNLALMYLSRPTISRHPSESPRSRETIRHQRKIRAKDEDNSGLGVTEKYI